VPRTLNEMSIDELAATTEAIMKVSAELVRSLNAAKQANLQTIWAPWTDSTFRSIGVVQSFAASIGTTIDEQILANQLGKPYRAKLQKQRSARDAEVKRKKKGITEPPKRGRPPRKRPS